jgi:hypothetical protein
VSTRSSLRMTLLLVAVLLTACGGKGSSSARSGLLIEDLPITLTVSTCPFPPPNPTGCKVSAVPDPQHVRANGHTHRIHWQLDPTNTNDWTLDQSDAIHFTTPNQTEFVPQRDFGDICRPSEVCYCDNNLTEANYPYTVEFHGLRGGRYTNQTLTAPAGDPAIENHGQGEGHGGPNPCDVMPQPGG